MTPNKPAKSRARPAGATKPAAQARKGSGSIKLDPELRIGSAADLFQAFAAAAHGPSSAVQVDGSGVEKVDTAAIQALIAGRRYLQQAGKTVAWAGASKSLRSAAELLGAADLLELS